MESAGRYPQTDAIALAMRLPRLAPPLRIHAGILLALAAAAFAYVLLFRTVLGYEMRAVGLNREASRLAGIRPDRLTWITLLASGGLAGLAGGIEVSALTFRLYEKFSSGYGFTAIAVALLGRLHPAGVILAALLFGALEAGSSAMQRAAGVSSVLVSVIQATVILSLIAVERRGGRGA
jgi:simple sugar transport system permease protein